MTVRPSVSFSSVRTKILGAFGLVSLIALFVGGLTVTRVEHVASTTDKIAKEDVAPLALIGDLHAQLWQSQSDGIIGIFMPTADSDKTTKADTDAINATVAKLDG